MKRFVPVGMPLLWKQASQTRTGARPQPLSGTGRVLEEHKWQKPSPHARQWCLVSLGWNSSPHLWHCWSIQISPLKHSLNLQRVNTKCVPYQDEGVGFPVGRSYLVSEPRGHGFGGFDAKFRHWLRNVFHSIQQPLCSIVVVFQEAIRLKKEPTHILTAFSI